jgi:hypothetical protein
MRQLLHELHGPLQRATLIYCDNVSAVYLSTNPVQHQRNKHVEIDLHSVHERVIAGDVRVLSVPHHAAVRRHLHQGVTVECIFILSIQSQHLYRIELRLRGVLESCLGFGVLPM